MNESIVEKVSKELKLPEELIDKTYRAYWTFIKDSIKELPLKDNLSKEEFSKLKCNFNIPSLGKLCVTYDRYIGIKKRFKYINHLREKNVKNKED